MWPFPLWNGSESLANEFEIMIEAPNDLPSPLDEIVGNWSEDDFEELLSGEGLRFSEAFDMIASEGRDRGISGFIAMVCTPVRNFSTEETSSFSWGAYYHTLIFGSDMADLTKNAVAWAKERAERDLTTWRERQAP